MFYDWHGDKNLGKMKQAADELVKSLEQEQVRLNSLKVGDIVFEVDCWGDYFEQSILKIDYVTGIMIVQDTSKSIAPQKVYHAWRKTKQEVTGDV